MQHVRFHWSDPGNAWSLQLTINWRNQWSMWEDKTMRRDCGERADTISVLLLCCIIVGATTQLFCPQPGLCLDLIYNIYSSGHPTLTKHK